MSNRYLSFILTMLHVSNTYFNASIIRNVCMTLIRSASYLLYQSEAVPTLFVAESVVGSQLCYHHLLLPVEPRYLKNDRLCKRRTKYYNCSSCRIFGIIRIFNQTYFLRVAFRWMPDSRYECHL